MNALRRALSVFTTFACIAVAQSSFAQTNDDIVYKVLAADFAMELKRAQQPMRQLNMLYAKSLLCTPDKVKGISLSYYGKCTLKKGDPNAARNLDACILSERTRLQATLTSLLKAQDDRVWWKRISSCRGLSSAFAAFKRAVSSFFTSTRKFVAEERECLVEAGKLLIIKPSEIKNAAKRAIFVKKQSLLRRFRSSRRAIANPTSAIAECKQAVAAAKQVVADDKKAISAGADLAKKTATAGVVKTKTTPTATATAARTVGITRCDDVNIRNAVIQYLTRKTAPATNLTLQSEKLWDEKRPVIMTMLTDRPVVVVSLPIANTGALAIDVRQTNPGPTDVDVLACGYRHPSSKGTGNKGWTLVTQTTDIIPLKDGARRATFTFKVPPQPKMTLSLSTTFANPRVSNEDPARVIAVVLSPRTPSKTGMLVMLQMKPAGATTPAAAKPTAPTSAKPPTVGGTPASSSSCVSIQSCASPKRMKVLLAAKRLWDAKHGTQTPKTWPEAHYYPAPGYFPRQCAGFVLDVFISAGFLPFSHMAQGEFNGTFLKPDLNLWTRENYFNGKWKPNLDVTFFVDGYCNPAVSNEHCNVSPFRVLNLENERVLAGDIWVGDEKHTGLVVNTESQRMFHNSNSGEGLIESDYAKGHYLTNYKTIRFLRFLEPVGTDKKNWKDLE